jgi:hypothetical protein
MSPIEEKELVLREFAKIGPKIEKADAVLKELYEQQNALIIRGNAAGLSAAAMARARQGDDDVKYVAESFRQVLRREVPRKARRAAKKAVKKTG